MSKEFRLPKVLIMNTDVRGSGINSLATPDQIKKVYGFKPLTAKSWSTIKKVLDTVGTMQVVTTYQEIAGLTMEFPEDRYQLNPPFHTADAMVLDTTSGLFWGLKQDLLGDKTVANQSIWDQLTNITGDYFSRFGALQIPFISTVHERVTRKGDIDQATPYLQGGFKDQIGSYFDVILYAKSYRQTNGITQFVWQVTPDAVRETRATEKLFQFAQKSGGEIDQDFGKLMSVMEIYNPKILIIGPYGSGKTHSLRTLKRWDADAFYKRFGMTAPGAETSEATEAPGPKMAESA